MSSASGLKLDPSLCCTVSVGVNDNVLFPFSTDKSECFFPLIVSDEHEGQAVIQLIHPPPGITHKDTHKDFSLKMD